MKNKLKNIAICLMLTMFMASTAFAAEFWKQKNVTYLGVAGETLSTGDAVYVLSTDGELYKADADDSAKRPCVGIIGDKTGGNGVFVEVVLDGILAGQTSATVGTNLFLSSTAGAIDSDGTINYFQQSLGFVLPALSSGSVSTTSTDYRIVVEPSPGARSN